MYPLNSLEYKIYIEPIVYMATHGLGIWCFRRIMDGGQVSDIGASVDYPLYFPTNGMVISTI